MENDRLLWARRCTEPLLSVRTGRTFLAVLGTALVISALWVGIACLTADSPLDFVVVPAVIGVIAIVGLLVGATLFSRFVEAREVAGRVEVRYVLKPRRVIPVPDIDEAVLVRALRLPSKGGGPSSAPRVVLRRGGRTVVAFTPDTLEVVRRLEALDVRIVVDKEPLTPIETVGRYGRRAVGLMELIVLPLSWVLIATAMIVVVWAIWELTRA